MKADQKAKEKVEKDEKAAAAQPADAPKKKEKEEDVSPNVKQSKKLFTKILTLIKIVGVLQAQDEHASRCQEQRREPVSPQVPR
jgi:hypothetical protein